MKYSTVLTCLVATLLMPACSGPSAEQILKVQLQKLTFKTMYDKNLVYDVVFDSEELNLDSVKKLSGALFLQGVDLFKNKRNPGAAVVKFKSSILTFPDAKTYYELGCALAAGGYSEAVREEAIEAFEVAQHLHFEPAANVHYKIACVKYQNYKRDPEKWGMWYVINPLEDSFKAGRFDTNAVAQDPQLKGITEEPLYKNLVLQMVAQNRQGSGLFDLYKRAYTNNLETYTLTPEKVEMADFRQSINYDFADFIPEMENTDFNREVSNDFYFVGRVKQTELYQAFLYTSIAFSGEEMQPAFTYLVVYDNEGDILSKKMVGCQCSAEKIKTFSVNNGTINITDMKRNWAKPITDVSFAENSILGYDVLAKAVFTIDDTGRITDKDVPANYNDSNLFTQASHE
ncbi:MAG: hypothetical protein V4590_07830 [Bacteroidota bacterium]